LLEKGKKSMKKGRNLAKPGRKNEQHKLNLAVFSIFPTKKALIIDKYL